MSSFEWNKIFGAILLAGLIATLSGFLANLFVHPKELTENAYIVELPEEGDAQLVEGSNGPADITPLLVSANLDKGAKLSAKCASCHTFDKGGANKIGPNLWNVVNEKQASRDFAYSKALTSIGDTWNYDNLNAFLYKPKDYVKGTKMTFAGMKKDQERADIIAWLRTLSDNPVPLP